MNDIKTDWENIDEFVGIPGYGITSVEKFIKGRSATIYNKLREIFIRDLIFKSISFVFIIINLLLYGEYRTVLILNAVLLFLLIIFAYTELRYYRLFRDSANPAKTSRENLTSLLTYLERKYPLSAVLRSATYMFVYVPGMLFYFILAYGYLKPIQPMGYFVYSFIFIIGVLFGYLLDTSQVKYHKKHIKLCLSDLNDNALVMTSELIESKRKRDAAVIVLTQVAIFVGLLITIIILKGIIT